MASKKRSSKRARRGLTRERILRAAVDLLDEGGLEAASMRNLARALGAGAMSLYNHVANKEELHHGIADLLAREILVPAHGTDWRSAMLQRAVSVRELILRHPWAVRLLESQTRLSEARVAGLEGVFATLREAGFSVVASYRSLLLMDSYIYGFTLQETTWRFDASAPADVATSFSPMVAAQAYPRMAEVLAHFMPAGASSAGAGLMALEFELGFQRILAAMEGLRVEGSPPTGG